MAQSLAYKHAALFLWATTNLNLDQVAAGAVNVNVLGASPGLTNDDVLALKAAMQKKPDLRGKFQAAQALFMELRTMDDRLWSIDCDLEPEQVGRISGL